MKKVLSGILLWCFVFSLVAFPKLPEAKAASQFQNFNSYPIVLVHGFAGFGRDEMLGFKYWGGLGDVQEDLKAQGYPTYTAVVGPFSSNWDRACELYAYIKGGTVDYGKAHSEKYGHERYGRTFPGLYPEWGEIDPNTGEIKKIHIIGHSMGGQTMRTLIQILEQGVAEEIAATSSEDLSPLFTGGKAWVASATSVSSPHDGTTLANTVSTLIPAAVQIVAAFSALASGNVLYDFKLDHWGLKRNSGESFTSYSNRVFNSNIWYGTKDICAFDLSPAGARELNNWVKASENVYYFSIANEATYRGVFTGLHYPKVWMNPLLAPFALAMGSVRDSSWRENDGVVNTISMNGPKVGSSDQIVNFNGVAQKGKWNYLGKKAAWDHLAIVGQNIWPVYDIYREQAQLLRTLPTEYVDLSLLAAQNQIEEDESLEQDFGLEGELSLDNDVQKEELAEVVLTEELEHEAELKHEAELELEENDE